MRALRFARDDAHIDLLKASFFQKAMQLHFAEAEPVISIQLAGAFKLMAEQIENHETSAAFQNPMRCRDCLFWIMA